MAGHIDCVVGARPNFMKIAPLLRALETPPCSRVCLVHTGQHYDASMSDVFFEQLGIRAPDVLLEVGSDTHARQTARIMERYEDHLIASHPAGVCRRRGCQLHAGVQPDGRQAPDPCRPS